MLWTSTVQGATLTVTKPADTNDGICDSDCSLREAIDAAAPGDLVVFPAGTYTLTFGSQLTIDKDLTLMGAGADVTTIQAATALGLVFYRVLEVTSGNVTISGVTLQHGNTPDFGGGILNMGNLTLTDSTVSNNSAYVWDGGGISNSGTLSTLTLVNSTVSGNTSEKDGGGIFSGGTLSLTNSTVSNNTSFESSGGGIANTGNMTLVNTTITNNSDSGGAGGVDNWGGSMDMVNTVIASNPIPSGPDCSGGTITSLGSNLIGNGSGCSFVALTGDLVGTVGVPIDALLGPLQNNGGTTDTHALLFGSQAIDGGNDAAAPAADQRGVLRPEGGASDIGSYEVEVDPSAPIARVDTYDVDEDDVLIVVAPGVLANDTDPQEDTLTADLVTGTSSGALTLETDGSFTYSPDLDYNGNDSFLYVANDGLLDSNGVTVAITVNPVVDILVVTKTGDTDDGICNEDCSLREAIDAATPGDLVDIPAGTYTLDLGSELSVEEDLTLSGAGSGDTIIQGAAVFGTAGTRVLAIQEEVNANISGVTIRHGDIIGINFGAGISNEGNLTLSDSAVTHNLAESLGGGIHNSGVAELTGITVSGNKSGSAGGGIHNNFGGILSLNNTRVINNGAVGDGGGINNYSTLTVVNSSISVNEAGSRGGGIFVNGPTTMTGSLVSRNVAASGGGIYAWTNTATLVDTTLSRNKAFTGGGFYNGSSSPQNLTGVLVTRNRVSGWGGGIYALSGTLTMTGGAVTGNSSENGGGGFYVGGTLIVTDSTVGWNSARLTDGGFHSFGTVTLNNTTTLENQANDDGGGIYNTGTLTLFGSSVDDNVALDTGSVDGGGGIYNSGTLTLEDSSVSNNQVTGGDTESAGGGGIYNDGTLAMTNSEVSGNDVGGDYTVGGGIYNNFGSVEMVDSTISDNITRRFSLGGGIYSIGGSMSINRSTFSGNKTDWDGGGIYNYSTDLTVLNSTFSGNLADSGGAIYHGEFVAPTTTIVNITHTTITKNKANNLGGGLRFSFAGEFNLSNTIIANNTAPTGPDCYDDVPSQGFNLIGDGTGCSFISLPSDQVGTTGSPIDPLLGPLQDNLGPTFTHALDPGSPAVDAVPVADCDDSDGVLLTIDQRSMIRS